MPKKPLTLKNHGNKDTRSLLKRVSHKKPSPSSSSSSSSSTTANAAMIYPGMLWNHVSSLLTWTRQSLGLSYESPSPSPPPSQPQPSQTTRYAPPRRWKTSLRTHANNAARILRRRYILSYTKNRVQDVFSKKWMKQALRWDFVGVSLSKMWGKLNSKPLPVWARKPIYEMWGRVFHCNMDEVRDPLHTYPTLAEFFSRHLKEGARPICQEGMASPVDGKVMSCGEVRGDLIEHVKGKSYSLSSFLGSKVEMKHANEGVDEADTRKTKLYHCVLYLSPGDYHRIHFPTACTLEKRRHFPGTLFPVNPHFLKLIPSLFALNERVALLGDWEEGFFSLTAVGAYNVGSITLNFDEGLSTNNIVRDYVCPNLEYFSWNGVGKYAHECDYRAEGKVIEANKGDELGQFHFGSTVVLIFEAENFDFTIRPGDLVKMGERIGGCSQ